MLPELKPRQPNEFHGVDVSVKYSPRTEIVVNKRGKWVLAEVAQAQVVNDNVVKIDLVGGDEVKIKNVKDLPKVVEFSALLPLVDKKMGLNFTIDNPMVTEDGRIEFDIKETVSGKEYKGVSQEFLTLWKATLDLEKELSDSEDEIAKFADETQEALKTSYVDNIKKTIFSARAHLPGGVGEMAKQTKKNIQNAVKAIEQKHKEAEKKIAELKIKIADAKNSKAEMDKALDPFHVDTPGEVAEKNKEAQSILDRIKKKIDKKIELEKQVLDARKDTAKRAYEAAVQAWEANIDPRTRKPVGQKPPTPDYAQFELGDAKKAEITKDVTKTESLEIIRGNDSIRNQINAKRIAEAKGNNPNQDLLEKDAAGNITDYKLSEHERVNLELFDKLVNEWSEPYTAKGKVSKPDKFTFDFDKEAQTVENNLDKLVNAAIPKDASGIPEGPYVKIYKKIQDAKLRLSVERGGLQTLPKAIKEGLLLPPNDTQKGLGELRQRWVDEAREEVDKFSREIENIKLIISTKPEFKAEQKMIPIDFTSAQVEEILHLDIDKAKTAMKKLYRGEDATEAFKGLVGNNPPTGWSAKDLREAGIKDWTEFKKQWDGGLAKAVAERMKEMAVASILRKVNEALDTLGGVLQKVKATAGQLAARAGLQSLVLLGASAGASYLLSEADRLIKVAAAGATSGVVKWGIGSKLFGNRAKVKMEAVAKENKEPLVDALVNEFFSASSSTPRVATPVASSWWERLKEKMSPGKISEEYTQKQTATLEGTGMMASVIAKTLRDETAEAIDVGGIKLEGSNRLAFERVLAHFGSEDQDMAKVKELAATFANMNRTGGSLLAEAQSVIGAGGMSNIDQFILHFSGRGNDVKKSVAVNVGVSTGLTGLMMVSGMARAAFGAGLGAYGGYKYGERKNMREESDKAKQRLAPELATFSARIKIYSKLGNAYGDTDALKSQLLYFKKFLHKLVPEKDRLAVEYETQDGKKVDELLLTHIESLVYDAERSGVLVEDKEDQKDVEKMTAIFEEFRKKTLTLEKKSKVRKILATVFSSKNISRFKWAAIGGFATGGWYLLGGALARPVTSALKGLKKSLLGDGSSMISHPHTEGGAIAAAGSGAVALGHSGDVISAPHPEGNSAAIPDANPIPDHTQTGTTAFPGSARAGVPAPEANAGGTANPVEPNHPAPITSEAAAIHSAETGGTALDFATAHKLNPEYAGLVQQIVEKNPALIGHPENIERIWRVYQDGGFKTRIGAEGHYSLEVFRQLKLIDNDAAANYLKNQHFGGEQFKHLKGYVESNTDAAYDKFVKDYDQNNKAMDNALRHALQAKRNTMGVNSGAFDEDPTAGKAGHKLVVEKGTKFLGLDTENGKPVFSGKGAHVVATHLEASNDNSGAAPEHAKLHLPKENPLSDRPEATYKVPAWAEDEMTRRDAMAHALDNDTHGGYPLAGAEADNGHPSDGLINPYPEVGKSKIVLGKTIKEFDSSNKVAESASGKIIDANGNIVDANAIGSTEIKSSTPSTAVIDILKDNLGKAGTSAGNFAKSINKDFGSAFGNKSSGGVGPDAGKSAIAAPDVNLPELQPAAFVQEFDKFVDDFPADISVKLDSLADNSFITDNGSKDLLDGYIENKISNPLKMIAEKVDNGFALTDIDRQNFESLKNIVKAYQSPGSVEVSGVTKNPELNLIKLMAGSKSKDLPMLANGGPAVRIQDGSSERLFISDGSTFSTDNGELVEHNSNSGAVIRYNYNEALQMINGIVTQREKVAGSGP